MNKLKTLAASIVLAASAFAPAHAGISINGISPNGISINGISINGFVVNGLKRNGFVLNGLKLNGFVVNGLRLNGAQIHGLAGDAKGSTGIEAGRPVAVTLPASAASF